MIPHPFKPDPHGRDVCDAKTDEDGQIRLCGARRDEHMDSEHALRIQLATAIRERDEARAATERWLRVVEQLRDNLNVTLLERDSLRTALTEIINLSMDVADTPDWRKKVGDKARAALHGEPGWERK